jgi:hypothetical protein
VSGAEGRQITCDGVGFPPLPPPEVVQYVFRLRPLFKTVRKSRARYIYSDAHFDVPSASCRLEEAKWPCAFHFGRLSRGAFIGEGGRGKRPPRAFLTNFDGTELSSIQVAAIVQSLTTWELTLCKTCAHDAQDSLANVYTVITSVQKILVNQE